MSICFSTNTNKYVCFCRQAIISQHKQEITDIQDIIFAMEQENQEQDIEMKQEFQSYRDEIKNKVCLPSSFCVFRTGNLL